MGKLKKTKYNTTRNSTYSGGGSGVTPPPSPNRKRAHKRKRKIRPRRNGYAIGNGVGIHPGWPWPMNQPMGWTVEECVEANHPGNLHSLCIRMADDSHTAIAGGPTTGNGKGRRPILATRGGKSTKWDLIYCQQNGIGPYECMDMIIDSETIASIPGDCMGGYDEAGNCIEYG